MTYEERFSAAHAVSSEHLPSEMPWCPMRAHETPGYGEGGSRLRPKWEGMTQHGKDFPNRVGNTTTNTTTQRMSLMRSRPTHEGKCPGRFQITDDFRQTQKKAEHP